MTSASPNSSLCTLSSLAWNNCTFLSSWGAEESFMELALVSADIREWEAFY
eukprot:CAMPEP_0202967066 /NCGR_PEP_ID=MMETSP1396-20130829/11797_1 /ASSEMBLY_ACC=CAM_ASM_000872 /TAXON_ID= /ORGANISM="Pseudokeronopsis sp., Strain Brazil" /LENGTH=50 /DNA_ID=CAMNT_0049691699 /DNA_START=1466 /DNA_END=1618 /DNA_ORIENTATION=-